ncbi:MAG: hypothetical protein UX39_C0021G0007 [Candidatus Magasanikbacteria bacterium GW2011_GWA2_46_17]|uniref:DUF5666 domain-containing protein n=1 Tax=Candidatus Magasanikbacteria bacterium GW2011_GWA2_46_17 TaxID=1619042 RepID=A0A0G1RXW8_9BACT|nr:MAG: hypothetical protein UX39_C0021G0007 [Candidatus Magasanikbacteria bacterium GW2011_GWA2_46_17]
MNKYITLNSSSMKKIIPVLIALIAVGGVSFYGGMKYAGSKRSSRSGVTRGFGNLSAEDRAQRFVQMGMGDGSRRMINRQGGVDFVNGEVISKDDDSVTVKLRDGGSRIVFFSPSTTVMKATSGDGSDLEVGRNVMINGSANQDGSMSAQMIQIRPAGN